jgi:hypothetical protein
MDKRPREKPREPPRCLMRICWQFCCVPALRYLSARLRDLEHEVFCCLYLD